MFRELSGEASAPTGAQVLKIGVLTFHRCVNYGSYWQARCLVEGLQARGHRAVLLDYACPQTDRIEWRCAMQPALPRRSPREAIRLYARKARAFQEAIAALPVSARFPLGEPELMERSDVVVVGSDEVWNLCHPWYGGNAVFWGQGVAAPRLVSYAASFGNYDADAGIDPFWSGQLARFDAISVRDDNSRRLVATALEREPALVLDPVLQFPRALEGLAVDLPDEPYVAVYGHGFSDGFAQAVRRWADARNLRLVSIGYVNAWAHEQRIDADPLEFAGLMAGAQSVVTNFFHGCVFALVNAKPFACAITPYRMNKVRDLTSALGAGAHLLHEQDTPERFAAVLDQPLAQDISERIVQLRHQSEDYLRSVGL